MDKKQLAGLLAGVKQMGRHMRGKPVPDTRVTKVLSLGKRAPDTESAVAPRAHKITK
jgi:hypothetical protein